MRIPCPIPTACLAALIAGWSAAAAAALGGDLDSVQRDREALHATGDAVTPGVHYDLHEAKTTDGVSLRQYVDRSGKVFAVSWQGPRSPDVGALLGNYAARYHAAQARRGNHHILTVHDGELMVTVMRLPRGWQGQALLTDALPDGVDRSEIR
jgi:hypothetical protein